MTKSTVALPIPLEQLPSGVPGLDTILGGGFFRGGSYTITGAPGTGKTILANHLAFNRVAAGERAVYFTLLGAEHARMLSHLQSFYFFQSDAVGNTFNYYNSYGVLRTEGLSGFYKVLMQTIRAEKARVLIIDELGTAAHFAESALAFQQFVRDLQILSSSFDCTTFLIAYDASFQPYPASPMVDGVIELRQVRQGRRTMREIEVSKFRGALPLEGAHYFRVNYNGLTVYPQMEQRPKSSFDSIPLGERERFGIPELDAMFGGGLLNASTALIIGSPGVGKTPFGIHFLTEGARMNEPGLYFGCYEHPTRLLHKSDYLGVNLRRYVDEGLIEIAWQPPVDSNLDQLASELLEAVEKRGVRRLFVDGLDAFEEAAFYPDRMGSYLTALSNELRARGVTNLFTHETPDLFGPPRMFPVQNVSAMADAIISLHYQEWDGALHRLISILKMRASTYDPTIRIFTVTEEGVKVAGTVEASQGEAS